MTSRRVPPINNERQLRAELEDTKRKQMRLENEDQVVEFPRRLLLRSPNGTYFAITVDNAGALSAINVGTKL